MSDLNNKTLTVGFAVNTEPAKQDLTGLLPALQKIEQAILNSSMQLSRVINNQAHAMAESMRGLGRETQQVVQKQESFLGALGKAGVAMMAYQTGTRLLGAYNDGLRQTVDYQRQVTDSLIAQMKAERELQFLRDRMSTAATSQETIKHAIATGLSKEEQATFEKAVLAGAAQYVGTKITGEQEQSLSQKIGGYAAASGIDAKSIADLEGVVIGTKDISRAGEKGVKQQFGEFAKIMAILQVGKGENAPLAASMASTISSMYNEDKELGISDSLPELATLISTIAQSHPESTDVHLRAAVRGLRDFGDKDIGPVLKRSGITSQDSLTEAVEKLAPTIREMATTQGVKPRDVLSQVFKEERAVAGLSTLINQGLGPQGTFAQRSALAAGVNADDVLAKVGAAQNDPRGPLAAQIAENMNQLADTKAGAGRLYYNNLAKQAEARLKERGEINTPGQNTIDYLYDTFARPISAIQRGHKGARAEQIDAEIARIAAERGASPEDQASIRAGAGTMSAEAAIERVFDRLDGAAGKLEKAADAMMPRATPRPMQPARPAGVPGR